MKKAKIYMLLIAAAGMLVTGCTSIGYMASPGYVGFSSDGAKTVEQSKKTSYSSEELIRTYDDELIYDEDGNVIKHIQTQYFDQANKFDEYVITYQKIGGEILPKSAAINGVVYIEVEYDLLPVEHEGKIPDYTSMPVFYRNIRNNLLLQSDFDKWSIDLGNFDMPFRIDGKFVESEESFDYYRGFDNDSVLTTGWNNILLQKFTYSRDKFIEGYNLTMGSGSAFLLGMSGKANDNTTFIFNWDVKADKLIQTDIEVVENHNKITMDFKVEREFDSSARLTREIWTVTDNKQRSDVPVVLYEQKLTY